MHPQGKRRVKVSFELSGLKRFADKIDRFSASVPPAMDQNKDAHLKLLLEQVRRNASGRPGPNIVTGHYVSSFMIVEDKVVNPSRQTRRLEYGFSGVDSLGRHYDQPAFPHFRPALAIVGQEYRKSIVPLMLELWRKA